MEEILDRGREEAPGPLADSSQQGGGQADTGGMLRTASEAAAVVSAGVLVGGGAGMLAGVALGAINPFALGMVCVVLGIGLPVLLRSVVGAREGAKRPWWRRTSGRRTSKNPHKAKFSCRLSANRASRKSVLSLCEGLLSCPSVPRP